MTGNDNKIAIITTSQRNQTITVQTSINRGRITRTANKRIRSRTESTSDDEDSESSEGSSMEYLSRVTRNGDVVMRHIQRIQNIMNGTESSDKDSLVCIICCDRKKNLLLLPWRHMHTCMLCWSLWCMNSMTVYNEDDDGAHATCPYCKSNVDSILEVFSCENLCFL